VADLNPCPFCASASVDILQPPERDGYVRCFGCGAVAQTVAAWNKRDERDAKRYRWLRDGCLDSDIGAYRMPHFGDGTWLAGNSLDASIDVAMGSTAASGVGVAPLSVPDKAQP
jgi:hypothetical protein